MGRIASRTDPGNGPGEGPGDGPEGVPGDEAGAAPRHVARETPGPAPAGLSWLPAVTVHGLREAEAASARDQIADDIV